MSWWADLHLIVMDWVRLGRNILHDSVSRSPSKFYLQLKFSLDRSIGPVFTTLHGFNIGFIGTTFITMTSVYLLCHFKFLHLQLLL